MIVRRHTIFCKAGGAGAVANGMKDLARILTDADDGIKAYRVYTDLSGRTDRVITEIERETLIHPREATSKLHGRTEAAEIFGRIGPHIESAEVEFLELEVSV